MVRRYRIISLFALIWLLAACSGGTQGAATGDGTSGASIEPEVSDGEVRVGEPAPTFRLPSRNGQVLDLEEMKGRAVILNFWATWCGPCRLEMPALQAAHDRFAADGLEVIGVEVGSSGSAEESAAFLEEVGVTFPTYRDETYIMEDQYLKRPALPTTVFIDREGIIHFVQIGPMTEEFIEAQLDDLGF